MPDVIYSINAVHLFLIVLLAFSGLGSYYENIHAVFFMTHYYK